MVQVNVNGIKTNENTITIKWIQKLNDMKTDNDTTNKYLKNKKHHSLIDKINKY